ncbi:LegC family aminotransferase [Oceanicoccus sp. KOV_DT_Chl]|uniref:LegC family aminotransferase n=1 Tax=Oceanicoccus sp. KOV_DT_Chl TaxID=1904639 RepID=UPI000C7A67C6|nr:LegC family aminotransferase [Oceanicoccus sp. KOV_DT_Chl]
MSKDVSAFVHSLYKTNNFLPLHEPVFSGNEKKYVLETIDSTFVSSVGEFVDRFEKMFADYVGGKYAVATVNGTAALHVCLLMAEVVANDEVITQPLTFVATCNAISYCGAIPVFIDVDRDSMGLSADKLAEWLAANAEIRGNECFNRRTGRRIKACVPMHTFGHPARIEKIKTVCDQYGVVVVEDAAESLGSFVGDKHTGAFSELAAFSFNGNKTITTGGGGMLVTDNEALAKRAKHITTTAKLSHPYKYVHDEVAYNYRMPNLNAALGCAQMEQLDGFLAIKRSIAEQYKTFFESREESFVVERAGTKANYWLNAIVVNEAKRDEFIEQTNALGVMTRPIWGLMNRLPMFKACESGDLGNAEWLEARVVNLPSGVISPA